MFKLFSTTEKPTSSHSRSKTQPSIHTFSGNINTSLSSTANVNGQEFSFVEPTPTQPTATKPQKPLFAAPLTEPSRAHQPNLAEQVRSVEDLPPLSIKAVESDTSRTSQALQIPSLPPSQQDSQLQRSLLSSRQSSPIRASQSPQAVDGREKQGKTAGKLASWFRGESEPITIGLLPSPIKEKVNPLESTGPSSESQPTSLLQRKSTASTCAKPAMATRFSFFANKAPAKPATQSLDLDDELIDIDISAALLPAGFPDPLSPAAFRNLQQQAESLLTRLQTAYKERTILLRDMAAEKETLAEETEGAQTKVRHLKTQLDDLSAKLADQDEAMMNLVDELAQEKLARREEDEARKRSVRLVEHATPTNASRRRRTLSNPVSDSGFESEDDSSAESLFSGGDGTHSPAFSMSSVSTNNSPEAHNTPDYQASMSMAQSARLRSLPSHVRKGTSAICQSNVAEESIQSHCANCNGVRASEAWNVVSVLKEENRCIKERIGELENALDGCLDLVGNLS